MAGIGNIFLSDDGFGVEVANRLLPVAVPDAVRVADFGIRGIHLAYELLDGYDALILVDAVPMGEAPGTLALIEPDTPAVPGDDDAETVLDAHSMSPESCSACSPAWAEASTCVRGRVSARRPRRRHRLVGPSRRGDRQRGRLRCRSVSPGPGRDFARRGEGERIVIKKLLVSTVLAVIAAVVVKSLPDIARYLKMREM